MDTHSLFAQKQFRTLLAVVMVSIIIALGAYTYLTLKQAKGVYEGEVIINVVGEGEILAKPDIGEFSFGVRAEGDTAEAAQEASAEAINAIMTFLTEQGVAEKDIKTQNYNLNPTYRYEERTCMAGRYCPPGEPIIDGFEVYQMISVRVRDLENAGRLIAGVGEQGATDMSGLNFTIDDTDALLAEARANAIADAKEKAQALAKDLDVRLVRMTSFYEDTNSPYPMMEAYGGDQRMFMDKESSAAIAPALPTGENKITSRVTLSYEVE